MAGVDADDDGVISQEELAAALRQACDGPNPNPNHNPNPAQPSQTPNTCHDLSSLTGIMQARIDGAQSAAGYYKLEHRKGSIDTRERKDSTEEATVEGSRRESLGSKEGALDGEDRGGGDDNDEEGEYEYHRARLSEVEFLRSMRVLNVTPELSDEALLQLYKAPDVYMSTSPITMHHSCPCVEGKSRNRNRSGYR